MSEDTSDLTVTLKAGADFSSPWIVVRGDTPDDVAFKLRNLGDVIEATHEAAGQFAAGRLAAPQGTTQEPAQQAAPPTKPQGWGGQSRGQGGQVTSKFGSQLHPEGKTCEQCPNVLELKKSSGGKEKWQCPDWRWNNGSPNNHTVEWVN